MTCFFTERQLDFTSVEYNCFLIKSEPFMCLSNINLLISFWTYISRVNSAFSICVEYVSELLQQRWNNVVGGEDHLEDHRDFSHTVRLTIQTVSVKYTNVFFLYCAIEHFSHYTHFTTLRLKFVQCLRWKMCTCLTVWMPEKCLSLGCKCTLIILCSLEIWLGSKNFILLSVHMIIKNFDLY